jgi:bifunctional non-homologous end joining protein LigD
MPKRARGIGGAAFTVALPRPLETRKGERDAWWIELPERELRLSNLDKVFWPDEGYTKGDLIAYYFNVSDLLLPHLQ